MAPTVLLADDDEKVKTLLTPMLESAGLRVVAVGSGAEALAAAESAPPDLVLLDVCMPGLSGWDVLRSLRQRPKTRATPVVMISARADEEARMDGLMLGADDLLSKPLSSAALEARVTGLLRRHREALAVNPLTRLPGSPSIQAEVERRIREGRGFSLLHADIDRFKAFNDARGYHRGDAAILRTAEVLAAAARDAGETEAMLGHVGGDDFSLVCSAEGGEKTARRAVERFADAVRELDPSRTLSLSVGGVSTRLRPLDSYAAAVALAGEMKSLAKSRGAARGGWVFDRTGAADEDVRRVAYVHSPEHADTCADVAGFLESASRRILKRPVVQQRVLTHALTDSCEPDELAERSRRAGAVALVAVLGEHEKERLERLSGACARRGLLFRALRPRTVWRPSALDVLIDLRRLSVGSAGTAAA